MWVCTHPSRLFRQIIFQHLGVLATEIFIRARVWLRLGSAHHKPGQGSPKKFQVWTFKIGLKIPHRSAYNFRGSGSNLTKLYQGTWLEAGMIKWTLILQRVPPTKFGGQNCPKFRAILDNFRLCSRISPEQIDTSKIGKVLDQLRFIPNWAKKIWWT